MVLRKILPKDVEKELAAIGVNSVVFDLFKKKSEVLLFRLFAVDSRGANILKQEFLSAGGDVALNGNVASWKSKITDCLLIGTKKVYDRVLEKISEEKYFGLEQVQEGLKIALEENALPSYLIHGKIFNFKSSKYIMGILNVTPDSFSDGGSFLTVESALSQAELMINDGADIIDIGGESTRPNALEVSESIEKERVLPVLRAIRKSFPDIPISIDTYKSSVAKEALENGADIINDISGLRFDNNMVAVAAKFNVPVVAMHIKGTPKNMQENPDYADLMKELLEYFEERISVLSANAVNKIIIDPGIGFGKRIEDNLQIIRNLNELTIFNKPILIGISRKSFIGTITGEAVNSRLYGTLAGDTIAAINGANILRVHDVKPHKEMLKILGAIEHFETQT